MSVHAWAIAFVSIQKRLNIQAKSSPTCHWAQPDSSAWCFSTGGLIHSNGHRFFNRSAEAPHTHSPLSLSHESRREQPVRAARRQHSYLNGIWSHVLKKKKKWCVKYVFMMHESSVRSSGSRLFRVSVLVEDKQLMMVLCCSDLD